MTLENYILNIFRRGGGVKHRKWDTKMKARMTLGQAVSARPIIYRLDEFQTKSHEIFGSAKRSKNEHS